MAENKNIELNDEVMAKAAGGKLEPVQPYVVGDRVLIRGSEGEAYGNITEVYVYDEFMVAYDVKLDNGADVKGIPHNLVEIVLI